jgi:hypothetical protein
MWVREPARRPPPPPAVCHLADARGRRTWTVSYGAAAGVGAEALIVVTHAQVTRAWGGPVSTQAASTRAQLFGRTFVPTPARAWSRLAPLTRGDAGAHGVRVALFNCAESLTRGESRFAQLCCVFDSG